MEVCLTSKTSNLHALEKSKILHLDANLEKSMSKSEIMKWIKRHDEKNFWWVQQEREIGDRLRKTKKLTKDDLRKIIEWKFESNALVKTVQLNRIEEINEQDLENITNKVFNISVNQDSIRIKSLCSFNGIGPAVASVILTFYDPENYCVIDFHVYQEVFGFRPKYLTTKHYLRLLKRLRKEAKKFNLRTRDVEKAYFTKNFDT